MHRVVRSLGRWTSVALISLLAACSTAVTTTTILVRHAERPPGADPDINELGRARAESLVVALARTQVDAIIHTQFKRTQQTAAPLAVSKHLTPIVVQAAAESTHVRAVLEALRAFTGKTAVYVGHSNTVPAIIEALGITPRPVIPETEYRDFFIVRQTGKGPAELIRVRYGQ
jgi:broad specificity phosphatase PhoE